MPSFAARSPVLGIGRGASGGLRGRLLEAALSGLLLDFTNQEYWVRGRRSSSLLAIPGWSYTRSGTAYDLAGTTSFGANTPRRTSAGLLVEAASTNLALWSQDTSNAAWTKDGGSITSTTAPAPDGTATACVFTENTASTPHRIYQAVTVSSGATVTWSVFLSAGTRRFVAVGVGNGANYFSVRVDTQTWTLGATQSVGTGVGTAATITAVGGGMYRISVTGNIPATTSYFCFASGNSISSGDIGESYLGTSATIVSWGAQLETGSVASSYIPTTTASASRGADAASITGLTFSGAHSVVALTGVKGAAGTENLFALDAGSTANRTVIYNGAGFRGFVDSGSVNQADQLLGTWSSSAQAVALRVNTNDVRGAVAGLLGAADTTVTLPVGTLARLFLGQNGGGGGQLNGLIQLLAILPRALSDGELTGATA